MKKKRKINSGKYSSHLLLVTGISAKKPGGKRPASSISGPVKRRDLDGQGFPGREEAARGKKKKKKKKQVIVLVQPLSSARNRRSQHAPRIIFGALCSGKSGSRAFYEPAVCSAFPAFLRYAGPLEVLTRRQPFFTIMRLWSPRGGGGGGGIFGT